MTSEMKEAHRSNRIVLWDMLRDPRSRSIGLWTIGIVVVGTIFYTLVEGWSVLDSAYFCVITLATVGYGDLTPTTPLAKIFTIFYIINGLGVLVAFVDVAASKRLGQNVTEVEDDHNRSGS